MKVAVLTSLFPSAVSPFEGIFAERRWQGMLARGHEVTVTHPVPRTPWPFVFGKWQLIHSVPSEEQRGGIRVTAPRYLHLPKLARRNAAAFARAGLRQALSGGRPDVVVCDYAWPAAAAAVELQREGIACVISGRGSDVLEVAGEAGLGRELASYLQAAGHWCAVSEHLLSRMDELGGGAGTLVPNGVDTELFRIRDQGEAREQLGLETAGPLVIVVGHLIPRKDPLLALHAFVAGAPENAELVFIGNGELFGEVECAIAEQKLAARIRMVGAQTPEQLAIWYAAADCLLLTSRREGRPNVVLEALSSGCPVLATDAGGTAELLAPLEDMLVPASAGREASVVGAGLGKLLGRERQPERNRAAVADLSWERSLDSLESCLQAAVDSAARAAGSAS